MIKCVYKIRYLLSSSCWKTSICMRCYANRFRVRVLFLQYCWPSTSSGNRADYKLSIRLIKSDPFCFETSELSTLQIWILVMPELHTSCLLEFLPFSCSKLVKIWKSWHKIILIFHFNSSSSFWDFPASVELLVFPFSLLITFCLTGVPMPENI